MKVLKMEYNDLDFAEAMRVAQCNLNNAKRHNGEAVSSSTPVYRYIKKEHFLDLVENNRVTLSHISLWEDPFEGFMFKTKRGCDIRRMYAGFYGQSWTFDKYESDLRWRAYCPDKDGVRIKSTVGKIRYFLEKVFGCTKAKCLNGPVIYFKDSKGNLYDCEGGEMFHAMMPHGCGDFAKLLFLKKMHFKLEDEFRFICHIGHAGLCELENEWFERKDGLLRCKFHDDYKINNLIEGVCLDPRMPIAEVDRLKCRLKQADCDLGIKQSDAYRWPKLDVF